MNLKDIRTYFGENDKTQFEHSAYKFLGALVKQGVGGWISVKDQLPNCDNHHGSFYESDKVLAWSEDLGVHISRYYRGGRHGAFGFEEETADWEDNEPVTHWMPLPEPPTK